MKKKLVDEYRIFKGNRCARNGRFQQCKHPSSPLPNTRTGKAAAAETPRREPTRSVKKLGKKGRKDVGDKTPSPSYPEAHLNFPRLLSQYSAFLLLVTPQPPETTLQARSLQARGLTRWFFGEDAEFSCTLYLSPEIVVNFFPSYR